MSTLRDAKSQAANAARYFRDAADAVERLDYNRAATAAQAAALSFKQSRELYLAYMGEKRNER